MRCSYPGCEAVAISVSKRTCAKHMHNDPPKRDLPKCSVKGCDNPVHRKRAHFCAAHKPLGVNSVVTFSGETLTVKEWAARIGVRADVLCRRIQKGWPIERALTTPLVALDDKSLCKPRTAITYRGETLTLSQWARRIGIGDSALRKRLTVYGWSIERALTTTPLIPSHLRCAGGGHQPADSRSGPAGAHSAIKYVEKY